ncbi:hypothetical protein HPB47_003011 [Ixodes persulcatus]|uniref:Uncharacterized protein n=1 Tax=Ixodes persulcatus TaxID=34615 RepID=A0AC60PJN8_IXOPE|nr:hypothetical protein HPB47_003011 [Ixodes persulcatus]
MWGSRVRGPTSEQFQVPQNRPLSERPDDTLPLSFPRWWLQPPPREEVESECFDARTMREGSVVQGELDEVPVSLSARPATAPTTQSDCRGEARDHTSRERSCHYAKGKARPVEPAVVRWPRVICYETKQLRMNVHRRNIAVS